VPARRWSGARGHSPARINQLAPLQRPSTCPMISARSPRLRTSFCVLWAEGHRQRNTPTCELTQACRGLLQGIITPTSTSCRPRCAPDICGCHPLTPAWSRPLRHFYHQLLGQARAERFRQVGQCRQSHGARIDRSTAQICPTRNLRLPFQAVPSANQRSRAWRSRWPGFPSKARHDRFHLRATRRLSTAGNGHDSLSGSARSADMGILRCAGVFERSNYRDFFA